MHMRNLGQSSLRVSEACLGTMTWGVQNDQRDADAQIDLAREHGVNFIDTAEMYPVPTFADQWRAGQAQDCREQTCVTGARSRTLQCFV